MPVKGFDRIEDQSIEAIEGMYGKWNEKCKKFVIQNLIKIPYLCDESGIETKFSWMTIRTNIDREFYAKKIDRVCRQEFIQKVLSDYFKSDSIIGSCRNNNVGYSSFHKALSIIGAELWKPNLKTSEDLRLRLYEDYSNGMSGADAIVKYKTWHKQVREIVNYYGGDYKSLNSYSDNLNINCFSKIKCENSSYFLGLLLADGSVGFTNNIISIALQKEDSYLIESLKKFVFKNEDGPPVNFKSGIKSHHKDFMDFRFSSKEIKLDLKGYGMHPRKDFTAEIKLDKIDKSLWHHILRGFFDGDGCISFRNDKLKRAILQITTASKLMESCFVLE